MSAPLFAWLLLHSSCNAKGYRPALIQASETSQRIADTDPHCIFCKAHSTNRDAFDVVWEGDEFFAFRDRSPACLHHIQLIPKTHISSVRKLTARDADMVRRMQCIGNDILDNLQVPAQRRRMGFHVPPFNSVQHLHLHVQALPYTSRAQQLRYPVVRGFGTFDKGFSWFSEVGQTIRILDKDLTVGILPC